MTDPATTQGLTDVQRLAALDTYVKVLKTVVDDLRAAVTTQMGRDDDERKAARLPDGTKIAAITYSGGRKAARVTDEAAALAWCLERYPEEVQTVQAIRPAFLKMLLDLAKVDGVGMDGKTGEVLPFIEVGTGAPFVTVTTTEEGVDRMTALAGGFAAMLEAN